MGSLIFSDFIIGLVLAVVFMLSVFVLFIEIKEIQRIRGYEYKKVKATVIATESKTTYINMLKQFLTLHAIQVEYVLDAVVETRRIVTCNDDILKEAEMTGLMDVYVRYSSPQKTMGVEEYTKTRSYKKLIPTCISLSTLWLVTWYFVSVCVTTYGLPGVR